MKNNLAAIDLGTNSCRLLITDMEGKSLYKHAISTRLGEGMKQNGNSFTDEAVARGVDCFCSFKMKMDEFNVQKYRAIATAACRMAGNGEEFVAKVKQHSGIEVDVIGGYEEALLNLKGALLNTKDSKAQYVVVYDLGGGSTEITLATRSISPKILHTVSIPWGARNSSEVFGIEEFDPIKNNKLAYEISKYTKDFFEKAEMKKYVDKTCFVATSSTPLRLTHLAKGWTSYDRCRPDGMVVPVGEFDEAIEKVHKMSCKEMAESPLVGENRAQIYNTACVIFSQIYKDLEAKEIVVSLKSAVDGIIMELQNGSNQVSKEHSR